MKGKEAINLIRSHFFYLELISLITEYKLYAKVTIKYVSF